MLVFGDTPREHNKGMKFRNFRLGNEKAPGKDTYGRPGVENCLYSNFMPRTEERMSKGRRAFHALTSLGIKEKGNGMSVGSTLFWTIIIQIVTYGSEV